MINLNSKRWYYQSAPERVKITFNSKNVENSFLLALMYKKIHVKVKIILWWISLGLYKECSFSIFILISTRVNNVKIMQMQTNIITQIEVSSMSIITPCFDYLQIE